jgi:hypothetical protein
MIEVTKACRILTIELQGLKERDLNYSSTKPKEFIKQKESPKCQTEIYQLISLQNIRELMRTITEAQGSFCSF